MAATKPMGVGDPNESTARGVTGFHQEYNQDPGPRQDLNPDVVDDPSVLPKPLKTEAPKAAKAPRVRKTSAKAKK